jgi:cytochrome c peroxidase
MASMRSAIVLVGGLLVMAGCSPATNGVPNAPDASGLPAAVLAALKALSPDTLPPAPPDPTNRFADDPAAAAFGQTLFYDPSFSGRLLSADNDGSPGTLGMAGQTGRVACAGCHLPTSGFSDTRSGELEISLGAGWGRRRAPSLLDVGQARVLMWDGRRDALYNQVFGPLETVVEMNSSRLFMAEQIYGKYRTTYEAIFGPMPPLGDATQFPPLGAQLTGCQPMNPSEPAPTCDGTFHGSPGDHAEFDGMTAQNQTAITEVVVNAGKAIGAFERLLTCGPTPFDAWMHGGAPIAPEAQNGAALFVDHAGCVKCHSGPFMSDQHFHNVGLTPLPVQAADFIDANDQGALTGVATAVSDALNSLGAFSDGHDDRLAVAEAYAKAGAFRTPTLRCVATRPRFLHTGQQMSLADVVNFFNEGGSGEPNPGHPGFPGTSEIAPLGLSPSEVTDIVAFLESLTGSGADPKYLSAP